ncbi:MAG: peptidase T [Clostridia bacterium]|nr:peptidase T [Clostridia bacterium]
MKASNRLLHYVSISTPSQDGTKTLPSTDCQFDLGNILVTELLSLGLKDARIDEKCYVYASLPATEGRENAPKLGFVAHMDTAPDFNGVGVKPMLHPGYDGGDVALGGSGRVLKVADFPHLKGLAGRTLITTDGTSLLGADDKAGIAEIMTMLERLVEDGIPHGKISVCFTPDEEIGAGADGFDVEAFDADFAYTVDGGEEGELEYENFNAAEAVVEFFGFNVHPGSSKNTMVNASLLAMGFNSMLPSGETPRDTEGYEGFFHLTDMSGNVEKAVLKYIIRDHDTAHFAVRLGQLEHLEKLFNERYGEGSCKVDSRLQYRNMKEMIEPHMHLIDNARAVIEKLGVEPKVVPIRGGTDGARLSYMGLPCPNLGTGGYAFHGPYEHITVEGMDICVEILLGLVKAYAEG